MPRNHRRIPFGAHALSPFTVAAKRIEGLQGCGEIVFHSKRVGGEAVPVILIDGEPAATGCGSGRIAVPAGKHSVQFQSGECCRTWPVDVPEGGEVRLASTDPEPARSPQVAGSDAVVRIDVGLRHETEFPKVLVEHTKPRPIPLGAQPIPGRQANSDANTKEYLGEELSGFARWLKFEWNHLLRVMGWDQGRRGRLKEAKRLDAARRTSPPWIDPPRITIGDQEHLAAWGRNEFRVEPGTHLVEVAVPGPPRRLDRETHVDLPSGSTLLYELDLKSGATITIEARAYIKTKPSDDGQGLAEYSGRIKAVGDPRSDVP